jgi:hypothetical protein
MICSIIHNDVGLRVVAKGESYTRRCVNTDGHPNGVIDSVAVTDGVCVVTPEGEEFFAMWGVMKMLNYAYSIGMTSAKAATISNGCGGQNCGICPVCKPDEEANQ